MDNINRKITPAEARNITKLVTELSERCWFTKLEGFQIAHICKKAIDRAEEGKEVQNG